MPAGHIDLPSLRPLFSPSSVAIVGASSDATRIGGRPVAYLKQGFAGPVYPINPNRDEVQGLKAYKRVADIDGSVDLAVIAVPANLVEAAVEDCAGKGVGAAVILSAGFAEAGEDGEALQRRAKEIARRAGMRVLGPNCYGIMNMATAAYVTFGPLVTCQVPESGYLNIISQSGAIGGNLLLPATERGLPVKHWVTTGNEMDVEFADCLAYFADDPGTNVIMGYFEGCRNGPKLIEALGLAYRNRKPVVLLKVGRTEIGAEAAASHTAALAGADKIYDALFRQYNVHRAQSIEEMFDVATACAIGGLPKGKRVGIVTVSGGAGIMMADEAVDRGLEVAQMPEEAQRKIQAEVPFATARNPIDVSAQVVNDPTLFQKGLKTTLEQGGYDLILAFHAAMGTSPIGGPRLVGWYQQIAEWGAGVPIALSTLWLPEYRKQVEALGFPTFEDPVRAVRAMAALAQIGSGFDRAIPNGEGGPSAGPLPKGAVSEVEALHILRDAGLPTVEERIVRSADEAAAAAGEIGLPVVLKVVSPDITHKSDVGGVALGLRTQQDVRDAYDRIMRSVAEKAPSAKVEGCLVAPMVSGGIDTILGIQRDPVFGPVVMFGIGGMFVEVLQDVSFRVAPFDEAEAHRMIREIRGLKALQGARGRPPADLDAIAAALAGLSRFAAAHADQIETLDVNPFIVREPGQGGIAVDALLVTCG